MIGVVIGAGYHEPAIQQMQACYQGGLFVYSSRYLFWKRPIDDQIRFALGTIIASGIPVKRFFADCEGDCPYELEYTVALIQLAIDTIDATPDSGIEEVGIYTRKNWWKQYTNNTEQFSNLLLWDANDKKFVPYGGWKKPTMTQYLMDTEMCGRKVDLSRNEI